MFPDRTTSELVGLLRGGGRKETRSKHFRSAFGAFFSVEAFYCLDSLKIACPKNARKSRGQQPFCLISPKQTTIGNRFYFKKMILSGVQFGTLALRAATAQIQSSIDGFRSFKATIFFDQTWRQSPLPIRRKDFGRSNSSEIPRTGKQARRPSPRKHEQNFCIIYIYHK